METPKFSREELAKYIMYTAEESFIERISSLIPSEEIVAFSTDGKPITTRMYKDHIDKVSKAMDNGNVHSSTSVQEFVLNPSRH